MKNILFWVFIYGLLWAFLELTFGCLMHIIHFPAGAVLFPAAIFMMLMLYNKTKSTKSLIMMALFVASLKFLNLLMPNITLAYILNPAISIVLESIIVVASIYAVPYIKRAFANFSGRYIQ